ncbi:Cytoplasmic dynein 2 heavy chain 1 [Cichlidogyrus casuarinus]|uniref:Cytoplasmic dynein 2 heavy chain 1 n=1 Tax=Cichlidogyrus casuarinus TaxID=1844966 RepID=A0ABD2Q2P4_9PLAT
MNVFENIFQSLDQNSNEIKVFLNKFKSSLGVDGDNHFSVALKNEIHRWKNKSKQNDTAIYASDKLGEIQSKFDQFARKEKLCDDVNLIKNFSLLFNSSLEDCLDSLDELYRAKGIDPKPYNEEKMSNLIENVCGLICSTFSLVLSRSTGKNNISILWTLHFKSYSELIDGMRVSFKGFKLHLKDSVEQLWAYYRNSWIGPVPPLQAMVHLENILEQLFEIRAYYEQLIQIIPSSDHKNYGLHDSIELVLVSICLNDLNFFVKDPLTCPSTENNDWLNAIESFYSALNKAEKRAAMEIHMKFSKIDNQSTDNQRCAQMVKIMKDNARLLKRPIVSNYIVAEKEALLASFEINLSQYKEELDRLKNCQYSFRHPLDPIEIASLNLHRFGNVSSAVSLIFAATQLQGKVEETRALTTQLLADIPLLEAVSRKCTETLQDLDSWRNKLFSSWSEHYRKLLDLNEKDGGIKLDQDLGLLVLKSVENQLLFEVSFPDTLIFLQYDIRCLSFCGYQISSKIEKACKTAEEFQRYAVVLKQVAHLYNALDTEIIECQRPLMLQNAIAFEKMVKHHSLPGSGGEDSIITWYSSKDKLEAYIDKLRSAAKNLISENRLLTKVYHKIIQDLSSLFTVNLLRERSKWEEGISQMRYQISNLKAKFQYNEENLNAWNVYLDHQLYKVLEHQYRLGLEFLNKRLPLVQLDLITENGNFKFKPPMEDVRSHYYAELRRFILLPKNFPCFTTGSSKAVTNALFATLIDENSASFRVCYRKAEILFSQLEALINPWRKWFSVDMSNMTELIKENCVQVADFEKNFKTLKMKGREVEKLPIEGQLDCFVINYYPVKRALDSLLSHISEALLDTLAESVSADLTIVESFIREATEKTSAKPQTTKELNEAREVERNLLKQLQQVKNHLSMAIDKDKLSETVSGCSHKNLKNVINKWSKIQIILEGFSSTLDEKRSVSFLILFE